MKNTDCLMLDGGYSSVGSTLIRLHNDELLESDSDDNVLSENNFIIPIRKIKYVEFHPSEERYNDEFGGLRSMIETSFAELGNTFFFFHANNPRKMIKHKIYNAKYNLAWLLLNIKKFVDKYNIPVLEHHEAWIEKDFDFPKIELPLNLSERVEVEIEKQKEVLRKQTRLFQSLLGETDENSDESTDHVMTSQTIFDNVSLGSDDDDPEIAKERRRRNERILSLADERLFDDEFETPPRKTRKRSKKQKTTK